MNNQWFHRKWQEYLKNMFKTKPKERLYLKCKFVETRQAHDLFGDKNETKTT